MTGRRGTLVASLTLAALLVVPTAASAADTYADSSRPDNNGDCLTPATACRTISGIDGAVAKAGSSGTVYVATGTYTENVTLPGGISLVALSGTPTITPASGIALDVLAGPAATIDGIIFSSNVASQPLVRLRDGAGSMVISDNTFTDPTPTNGDNQVGIRTSAQGAPQITDNTFTALWHGIEVQPPASGVPGVPLISGNTITGVHDIGDGVQIVGTSDHAITGPTTAMLVDNLIRNPGAGQSVGVFLLDPGSFDSDPDAPTTGVTMHGNRIIGGTTGIQDVGARGPVTLDGDVIARTTFMAVNASEAFGLGGDLTVTNSDIVNNLNIGIGLQGNHLSLDSSILDTGIYRDSGVDVESCTIVFSNGPTTSSDPCETFQTSAIPSFVDEASDDYHLTPTGNAELIDHGNPLAPPAGATDFDGDPRAIDADATCPLNPVRDIGADEVNHGVPECPLPPPTGSSLQPTPTGQRAAAVKRCKKKFPKGPKRKRCIRRANRLPL